ncbi:hypothetical protein J31TS4_17660 [Paenibacillus sp. J31TS4]|uniref:C40 family peptidase n=1 Tax=Paenibacillus sp. J31TS4 TaxID=2807195 RepID=UPI001B04442A|nr:C40 family peptidase [Paenibacillus sp. J31TS4]GIP38486.1 hypothetical protein J31TS4_17660 [Paenibacillus sp. J31TS4]
MTSMTRVISLKKLAAGAVLAAVVASSSILAHPAAAQAATVQTKAAQTSAASKADRVINLAQSLQSKVRYVWGKNDPSRMVFDCSSFTKYVFKQAAGVDMKWGANAQYNQFPKVAKANLRPGDLIFASVSTPGKIGHVGIYIGNGKMIHNLNPKNGVVVSDINTGYWKNHYVAAARPIR